MSDQSDSHNAFDEVFMTESDPSSPSVDQTPEPNISPVRRTRLLADIPPTTEREKELRSKFLNDPSTPKEHNLTLRELRHQILARRTRRHPPTDAVPGLDVPPLREHAWLDSLADAGDDSDSPTAMDQEDNTEVVYQRRTGLAASKAPMVEEDSRSGREEDDEVGPGTDDYPLRRHFSEPALHMEHLPLKPLTDEELAAYDYFASVDYDITFEDGKVVRSKEPSTWLPHTKYILGDKPLSALLLSPVHENGLDHLDLAILRVDNDYRPLTHLPTPPPSDYLTMHSFTNGRRGGNRHGPKTIRQRGRGESTSTRAPVVAAASAANSPTVPLRSSATRTVTRGGTLNRRRSREQTLEDSAANKRQAVEDPDTSALNEVQIEDLDPSIAEEIQDEGATAIGAGTAGVGSLVSQTTSSIKEKLRELFSTPSFLSNLSPGIFYRFREWIEKKEVPLSDAVAAAFAPQTVTPSKRLTDTYKASLETCQGLLKEAENKVVPLEDDVVTLRDRAALLEEAEENAKALTKAVEAANSEKDMAVLDASAAEARGAAKAVAEFKGSDDYVIDDDDEDGDEE
ncbi:hypothetical protein BVRB_4g097400 [Beta vulgaris subsp. vulgaris]|uniref:Uncharacterized protein n=1 Tax=Beta vulgaris subsp. vulgaris TaxID=3555 RepID=A0A0J8BAH3_BETVV|nr:hypothetical protein BVRB_4g097400 [Beta vulgaris subsp. vulgaris]